MMVLDEHLLDPRLRVRLTRWYRRKVIGVTQLRAGTIIPDEHIPALLCLASRPVFVTLNVADFWRRLSVHPRFGIICLDIPDSRLDDIPEMLRRLFALEPFRTRKRRLGKIVRVTEERIQFYTTASPAIQTLT
jgi:hypothetical protein